MKESIFVITDKEKENFLCRNTNGRYFGKPKKIKDIIMYPTRGIAENILVNGLTDTLERNTYIVMEYTLSINEKDIKRTK